MDPHVVADMDCNNPASEDRDEADRNNYNPDSDPGDNCDDGFGVAVAVAVAIGIGIRITVRVGVQVAVVVAVFVVVPIAVLSADNNPYSLYPSLYVSFVIGIGIFGRAAASDRRCHLRRTRRTHRTRLRRCYCGRLHCRPRLPP